jgi:hypothetical protein
MTSAGCLVVSCPPALIRMGAEKEQEGEKVIMLMIGLLLVAVDVSHMVGETSK